MISPDLHTCAWHNPPTCSTYTTRDRQVLCPCRPSPPSINQFAFTRSSRCNQPPTRTSRGINFHEHPPPEKSGSLRSIDDTQYIIRGLKQQHAGTWKTEKGAICPWLGDPPSNLLQKLLRAQLQLAALAHPLGIHHTSAYPPRSCLRSYTAQSCFAAACINHGSCSASSTLTLSGARGRIIPETTSLAESDKPNPALPSLHKLSNEPLQPTIRPYSAALTSPEFISSAIAEAAGSRLELSFSLEEEASEVRAPKSSRKGVTPVSWRYFGGTGCGRGCEGEGKR